MSSGGYEEQWRRQGLVWDTYTSMVAFEKEPEFLGRVGWNHQHSSNGRQDAVAVPDSAHVIRAEALRSHLYVCACMSNKCQRVLSVELRSDSAFKTIGQRPRQRMCLWITVLNSLSHSLLCCEQYQANAAA